MMSPKNIPKTSPKNIPKMSPKNIPKMSPKNIPPGRAAPRKAAARKVPPRRVAPRKPAPRKARLRPHLQLMPEKLQDRIATATSKGVLKTISKYAFATPHGVKANCYAYFLALPDSQWKDRFYKSQPGETCDRPFAGDPLRFDSRDYVSRQLVNKVLCDQPGVVHAVHPGPSGYGEHILNMKLPPKYILGCCIVGGQDYHFLRREGVQEMLNLQTTQDYWRHGNVNGVRDQLAALDRKGHQYCWSHISGWSGGVRFADASGRVITNPVPKVATGAYVRSLKKNRSNHSYGPLVYDTFVAFFVVRTRKATTNPDNHKDRDEQMVRERLVHLGITPNVQMLSA